MKTTFKLFALLCCLLYTGIAGASELATGDSTMRPKIKTNALRPVFNRSAGVHIGSQGLGFEVQHPLPYNMNLRMGASILPDVKTSGVYNLSSYNTKVSAASSNFWNAHLMMDAQPFYSSKSFPRKLILSLGAGYFPKAKGSATVMFDQNYQYGDMTFSPEEVGQLTTVSSWEGFAPYAGIGINNIVSANRFNLNLTMGTYYMESPEVTITGTNMLAGNSANSAKLQKNMADYRWLPVMQLNFNFNL